MTLSGNLGFVPLDEVLRLLTRAGNDGMVQITNHSTSGRIFVAGKGITLATTMTDFGLKEHLASSGYISNDDLDSVEDGSRNLAEFFGDGTEGLALLREITVESIYQLDEDDADFQVVRDQKSPYASPVTFDLESVLSDSRDRRDQWAKVSKTVTHLDSTLTINRVLERESVELKKDSWRLIAAMGSGASVTELAKSLGTTEFAVAKVAADLIGSGLVSIEKEVEKTSYQPAPAVSVVPSHPVEDEDSPTREYSEPAYLNPASAENEEAAHDVETPAEVAEAIHEKSWWDEPDTEKPAAGDDADVQDGEELIESDGSESTYEVETTVAETVGVSSDDDTEAFLEKVFSDLGDDPAPSDDGHGLMRRRRMGSILRELGED